MVLFKHHNRKVDRETGKVTNEIVWLTADEEDEFTVAQANSKLNADGTFTEKSCHGDVTKGLTKNIQHQALITWTFLLSR